MLKRWVHQPVIGTAPSERRWSRQWLSGLAIALALAACSESDDPATNDSSDRADGMDVGDATGDSPEGDQDGLPDGDEDDQADEDDQGDEGGTGGQLDAGVDGGRRDGGQRDGRTSEAPDAAADAGADEPDASSGDAGVDGEPDASEPDASEPVVTNFEEPGPYEVERENNVGEDFANNVRDDSATCRLLLPGLVGDNATPEQIEEAVAYPVDEDRRRYTLWRPATLEEGKRYPVVTWGNGTCGLPSSYGDLLAHIASHGFIVIAPNYRQIGNGDLMLRALEVLRAENEREESALFGKVDLDRVGASGHSQGAGSAVAISDEAIIDAVVAIEGGGSGTNGKPTFFIAGENDNIVSPATVQRAYNGVRGPAAYGLRADADHITPINEAEKMWGPVTAWFKAQLDDDETARAYFDDSCTLCDDADWTVERKNLD